MFHDSWNHCDPKRKRGIAWNRNSFLACASGLVSLAQAGCLGNAQVIPDFAALASCGPSRSARPARSGIATKNHPAGIAERRDVVPYYRKYFAQADANKDKLVDKAELTKGLVTHMARRREEFMKKYDKNQDGKIDNEEKKAFRAEHAK